MPDAQGGGERRRGAGSAGRSPVPCPRPRRSGTRTVASVPRARPGNTGRMTTVTRPVPPTYAELQPAVGRQPACAPSRSASWRCPSCARLGGRVDGGRVLEIGTGRRGTGLRLALQEFGAARADGVELYGASVEACRRAVADLGDRVGVEQGDATALARRGRHVRRGVQLPPAAPRRGLAGGGARGGAGARPRGPAVRRRHDRPLRRQPGAARRVAPPARRRPPDARGASRRRPARPGSSRSAPACATSAGGSRTSRAKA